MLKKITSGRPDAIRPPESAKLLTWYRAHGRDLPWRKAQGADRDYHIWLSEIMLQQTVVATVLPYYATFLQKWPRLSDLAKSSLDDVLGAWAGLGYYARARNLHKCAKLVCAEYGGKFPVEETELLKLPGIGPYTAAALSAILGGHPSVVVDGNVERVISRLYTIMTPLPESKPQIKEYAGALTPQKNVGDYAQGLMDLGATICTPRNPKCDLCPWEEPCLAHAKGQEEDYPKKLPKTKKPKRFGAVYWLENEVGDILLEKRPDKGIFGGMLVFPGTAWDSKKAEEMPDKAEILNAVPHGENIEKSAHTIRHIFTHFDLELQIWCGKSKTGKLAFPFEWCSKEAIISIGLPSAMKKVAALMIKERPRSPITPPRVQV